MEFKAICSNRVGSVYYVLLLYTVFLYDISLQRVCGFLEKADHNSSADYYGAGACISAQSGNEVSGTSSDEAVGTADEEQNKSKKNVARRCDRGGVGVLRGNRCTAYRGDCSFYHTEYTGDRHGASERGQEYHGLVG